MAGLIRRLGTWTLAAVVVLSALPGAAEAAKRVALVIGNSAYEHTDALRNPGNDAADMAAALGRLGFEVVLGTDLDLDGFDHKLDEFKEAARDADVTLFFYAGHGIQMAGKNWLVPTDAALERLRDLKRRAVELDDVLVSMSGTKKLVFLDACRNNPLAGDLARSMGVSRTAATSRGLARVRSGQGTLIGYATAPDDVAADGEGRNSPFTAALLAHIERPGLSVHDMFAEVSASVREATKGKQVPWMHTSMDLFHLVSGAPSPPPPKDTVASAVGAAPSPAGDAAKTKAAKAAYEEAKTLGTVAAWRVVVEHFGDTPYAGFAQAQIAKLEGKADPLVVAGGDSGDDVPPAVTPPASSPEAVEKGLGLSHEEKRLVQMGLASVGHDPGGGGGGGRTGCSGAGRNVRCGRGRSRRSWR